MNHATRVDIMNSALQLHGHRHDEYPLDAAEVTVVASICNRLARMLGGIDREGIYADFEIVQSHCPLDLPALLAASDRVFIEDLTMIIEAADRTTHSLRGTFHSRFMIGQVPA